MAWVVEHVMLGKEHYVGLGGDQADENLSKERQIAARQWQNNIRRRRPIDRLERYSDHRETAVFNGASTRFKYLRIWDAIRVVNNRLRSSVR